MDDSATSFFQAFGTKVVDYLPHLLAGVLLIVVGLIAGWIAKRIVVRALAVFRLERLARSFRWGRELSKADVRMSFFGFLGNLVFLIVFLVFLDAALTSMKLAVLARVLEEGVSLVPRLIAAGLVFGLGLLASGWAASSVLRALRLEDIPRASLLSRLTRAVLVLFFSALALIEMGMSSGVVLVGFTIVLASLAVLGVLLVIEARREIARRLMQSSEDRNAG